MSDNIVPTSGMRGILQYYIWIIRTDPFVFVACTAVVTELAYHNKQTIDADVSFLSEAEWRAELDVLLHDLVDEDGNIRRSTDLKSDAGVAWQKACSVSAIPTRI
jgi:predicted 3-demethylubiquinone-9 3-methyltransferase (glyoxalase superfamily)